ncbi:MAG TPA: ATP-binding protein [Flavobacteriales bacterium]|nr:ATP-binding protein [Flavobacteriales bacterium]
MASPVKSPRGIALLVSGVLAVVVGVLGALLGLPSGLPVWVPLVLSAAAFAASYFVVNYAIERFIHDRIRLIYRTVHDLKTGKSTAPELDMGTDVLGQVNTDVLDWATARRSEIRELREREKFRREFIGNVAHELKTPIFNIQGYILTLLEGGLEDDKVNLDFLERASRGVDRLTKIVEDLDMISKLESGVMEMSIDRMDLTELVHEVFQGMEMRARERGVTLRTPLKDPVWVMADHDRLSQVLYNLLANACNYGREGGFTEVRTFDMDDQVLVEVVDDGIGISREHLPRLFERFYRVGKSRSRHEGGSGLGLAIVKHIIDAHGQSITVKSSEGEGTTFAFTLQKAR